MHECFDIWEKNWRNKVHNVMLKTYADNLWKSWKIWKAGENVSE